MSLRDFIPEAQKEMDSAEAQLRDFYRCLGFAPDIDQNGVSDCSFAKQLYEGAYEQEWYLRQTLKPLRAVLEKYPTHVEETENEMRDAEDRGSTSDMKRTNYRIDKEYGRRVEGALRAKIDLVVQSLKHADLKRYPGMERWYQHKH